MREQATTGRLGSAGARPAGRAAGRWVAVIALAAVVAAAVWVWRAFAVMEVHIEVAGELSTTLETRAATVEEALKAAGVRLAEGDIVTPGLEERLEDGLRIEVTRGLTVMLNVDGQSAPVTLANGTVRDVLVAAGVRMGPLDRVAPVRETPIENGMEITVIRVVQEEIKETETLPFTTLEWAEPYLDKGERRVVREGREGLLVRRIVLTYENGELAARQVVSNEVIQEPVSRIIGVGTKETVNVLETGSGSYRYSEVLTMEATAYYPGPESTGEWADGYTYTGLRAGKGVVAVDPTVIELGTRLYIPGYGEAIAADIGGAIKGMRIDLGYDTYQEAIQFGRKSVQVYILED